jgi:serine protease Do
MSDFFPENEELKSAAENAAEDTAKDIAETVQNTADAVASETESVSEGAAEAANEAAKQIKEEYKAPEFSGSAAPERPGTYQSSAPNGEYSYSFRRADEPRAPHAQQFQGQYRPQNEPYFAPQYSQNYGQYDHGQFAQGQYNRTQYGQAQYSQGQNPYGSYAPNAERQYTPYQQPYRAQNEAPKKEKKKGGAGRAVLAVLLCVCIAALACGSGYLGALLYHNSKGISENETAVMYRTVETKTDSSETSVTAVADLVSSSVVEITTEFVTTGYFSFGQYVTKGAGSGVIISDDGYIVTNNHVIADTDNGNTLADKIAVRLRTGEEYSAELIGRDADADIAVIKIDAKDLSAAVWGDSDELNVGEQIVVVGNPLGELGGTVTTGIVSAQDREIKIDDTKMNLIQTDAAVNPGNSGGGMFNFKGELVGIVNAKSSGTGIEGLGFAIPGNEAKNVTEQLLEYGYVKGKVYLGITFYEASTGGWFSTDSSSGILYVYSCEKGYNDDVLKYGDQVVSVEGTAVSTKADVKAILADHEVGDHLTFTIIRNGKTIDVEVEVFEYTPAENGVNFKN